MSVTSDVHTRVEVTPVQSSADRAAFLEVPYRLHRDLPLWVPPLREEQRALLDERRNPFFSHGRARLFLARRQGSVVGRISAHVNPRFEAHHGGSEGFFGFFDAIDDVTVVRALTQAAGDWLAQQGRPTMLGPVSFTTNDECGLLVEGFDRGPAVMMPYSPPYYARLLEQSGFTRAKELAAWEFGTATHEDPRLLRAAARLTRGGALTVRPVDLGRFDEEAELVRRLYNAALGGNWGFCPFDQREFMVLARRLRPLLKPGLAVIGEVDGQPAGFGLALPDVAPALAAARGRLFTWGMPVGLARFWLAQRRLTHARLVAMGVREVHRGRGLELLMYLALSKAGQDRGLTSVEASWVLEDNQQVNSALVRVGARITKRYRLYRRPTARD